MSDTEQETNTTLPFEPSQQFAVLGHLIQNPAFFNQTYKIIQPNWFKSPYSAKVLKGMQDFYENFKRSPMVKELETLPCLRSEEPPIYAKILETIRMSQVHSQDFGLDFLSKEIGRWWQATTYQKSVKKSANLYNAKKPEEAFLVMEQMVREIKTTNFGEDLEVKFSDPLTDFEQFNTDYQNACTFGCTMADKMLAPNAPDTGGPNGGHPGSLLHGDMTIILAPTNIGKSTTLITVARHNILRGKRILWITHEMRPLDLKKKMWMSIMDVNEKDVMGLYGTAEGKRKIDIIVEFLRRNLVFIPLNKPGMTVEEVGGIIQRKQEESIAKFGRGFDMLIEDYPAKLSAVEARNGKWGRRERDEYIYNYFAQLGLDNKFHVLAAIQTNRNGSKVNNGNGSEEERLLTKEDVAESFGPMTSATNIITINRSKQDEKAERLIFYIDKSRSSETGWAIVCKTKYNHAITHSDSLGASCYRGSGTYQQKMDQYLDQYLGRIMPDSIFMG